MNETVYQILDSAFLTAQFQPRERTAHKGNFGHVLVVGGDHGMGGAVRLAAEAALRVGAGLVTVATRHEHVTLVEDQRPEIMCYGVDKSSCLAPLLERATVIVVGPGLGKSDWSRELFQRIVVAPQPKVIDADALNLLSEHRAQSDNWILTPHPGEAARLSSCTVSAIQTDRFSAAKKLLVSYSGVIVLKGAGTIVMTDGEKPAQCNAGNPGMASAGMGDVLSGVIGGLVAQHFSLWEAAKTGVILHATAGDLAAKTSGERGLLAMDLMLHLHQLVNPL